MKKSSFFFLFFIACIAASANIKPIHYLSAYTAEKPQESVPDQTDVISTREKDHSKSQSIEYTLPYPGILPDHPLYPLKKIRDKILDFLIRDPMKRIEYYLLMSDKRYAMGIFLTASGKYDLAVQTLDEAEDFYGNISQELRKVRDQGRTLPKEKKILLQNAQKKHEEVVKNIQKDSPENMSERYGDLLIKINQNFLKISSLF